MDAKIDGRTKEGRKLKAAAVKIEAATEREAVHETTHAPIHDVRPPVRQGAVVVKGRDGEVLTRSQPDDGLDPFEVPAAFKEPGWDYQWNVLTVYNSDELTAESIHQNNANGWRAVKAEGKWATLVPASKKGAAIIRKGQILQERPLELSVEARAQEIRKANQLVSDRNESLKLTNVQKSMQGGFAMNSGKYRGTGGDVRISVDQALDAPRPTLPLAGGGE
jgi:hypothetical protein